MEQAELVRRFFEELCGGHRFETLEELTTEDVIYTSPEAAGVGRSSVQRMVMESARAFADLRVSVDHLLETGNHAAARICLRGQHANTYGGIKSSHRRISIPCVYLFEFRNEKISRIEVFYDLQLLTSQMCNGQLQPLR